MTKPKAPQFIYLDPKASFWQQISELHSDDQKDSKLYGLPNLDLINFPPRAPMTDVQLSSLQKKINPGLKEK